MNLFTFAFQYSRFMKSSRLLFSFVVFVSLSLHVFSQQPEKKRADKQFDKAVQLYDKRDYAGAMHLLDDITTNEPAYAEAWLLKAEMYYDLKEYLSAIASYEKAVEIDSVKFPRHITAWQTCISKWKTIIWPKKTI